MKTVAQNAGLGGVVRGTRFLLAVLGLMPCLGCQSGILLTVTNEGPGALASLRAHTSGYSFDLGDLPAGSSSKVRVRAREDSHVQLEYGRIAPARLVLDVYFGPGYRGSIEAKVRSDSVVELRSSLR